MALIQMFLKGRRLIKAQSGGIMSISAPSSGISAGVETQLCT